MSIIIKIAKFYKRFVKHQVVSVKIFRAILLAISLNLLFGTAFYLVEGRASGELTLWDSIWWAMVTMTTVGYGDYYANTIIGRFFISYPCMLIGIGIIGYLVAAVAESVLEKGSRKRRGLMTISDRDHIVICHCPGPDKILQLVAELKAGKDYDRRSFVVVTDRFTEIPEEFQDRDIKFVKGDPTREDILIRANIAACAGIFILAVDPSDPASDAKTFAIGTIVQMMKKEKGLSAKVILELVSKENLKMLKRTHADGIVFSEGITDCLLVQEFLYPGVHDIIHQIISNTAGSQFYIVDTRLQGRKISDIQVAVLKHPANLQVIGIIKEEKQILNPPKTMVIDKGDKLIMLAESYKDLQSIEEDILSKSTKRLPEL